MANVIPEAGREFADPENFDTQVREYVRLKASIDALDARAKELRETLMEKVSLEGEEDSSGNIQLTLDFDADGVMKLEKQRRTKRTLDEDTANELILQLGLGTDVYEIKQVVNEDALMAAFYEGKITEEQLDSMFPVTVTWALRTLKK